MTVATTGSINSVANSEKKPEKIGSQYSQFSCEVRVCDTKEGADYDTAISAAGYGRYNMLLLLAMVCPIISALLSTSTISFVLPSAECDLQLTNVDKGVLNAVTYTGMIATGFVWGFLSDTLGRQKLMVLTFGLDAAFNFIAGLSQGYTVLLLAKLADGFVCAGTYAISMTYMAECNPDSHRGAVVQLSGLITALGTVVLPLLAWGIVPLDMTTELWGLQITSWRVFMILTTLPSTISAITFFFSWESPKFLLSKGKADDALDILSRMYAINTGKPAYTYPIKSLAVAKSAEASADEKKSALQNLLQGLKQFKPLLQRPYIGRAMLVFLFQFGALLGYNTIRLWMPQLFTTIMDAEKAGNMTATNVCQLLAAPSAAAYTANSTFDGNTSSSFLSNESLNLMLESQTEWGCTAVDNNVYINSIIIGLVSMLGFLASGYLSSRIGDIALIVVATVIAVTSCFAMYWGVTSILMLVFSSLFVTCTSISSTAILSITILLFPTETRTMAVALVMMFGQIGGTLGNVLFPVLLELNCAIPFFLLGGILAGTGAIVLLLPRNGDAKPSEAT